MAGMRRQQIAPTSTSSSGVSGPFGLFAADMSSRAATASADYATSLGDAQIAVQDGAEWRELWADTTGWSDSGNLAVAGGQAFTGTGGGMVRNFPITSGGSARVVTTFVYPGAAGGGGTEWVFFGVSSATQVAGYSLGTHFAGIGIEVKSGTVQSWNGSGTTDLPGAPAAGTYVVTATADETVYSLTMARVGSMDRWHAQFPRAAGTAASIAVWCNDARAASGVKIGAVGAKIGGGTTVPPAGEGGSPSVHYGDTGAAGASRLRYTLPAGFDSRRPTPAVICFHGAGGDADATAGLEADVTSAGYIFATSDGFAADSVGVQAAVDEYARVYRYLLDRFPISAVALLTESMGGVVAANTVAHRGIPLPACWVGYFPLLNLIWAWDGNTDARNAIIARYGVNPDGSDLVAKVDGYSPVQSDPKGFAGVPALFFHSPGDTVVTKADNTDEWAESVAGFSPVTVVTTSGEHGDVSNWSGPNIAAALAFLAVHLGR